MKKYIKLMRLKHWIKNGLVFLPVFCSGIITKENMIASIIAFFAFSFMASVVYIINDIKDVEKDRNHPRKCKRPIANGEIGISKALVLGVFLFLISIGLNLFITRTILNPALYVILLYLAINIVYSFGAKHIPILDVAILGAGFVLRVYYGAFMTGIAVSRWLFLTVLSASLFLGLGKRKKELKIKDEVRPVLKNYPEKFLESFMNICLCLVIVFYSLWSMEQEIEYLFVSIPFLIILFMEYMMYLERDDEGDPITILFQNKSLMFTTIAYIGVMAVLLFTK